MKCRIGKARLVFNIFGFKAQRPGKCHKLYLIIYKALLTNSSERLSRFTGQNRSATKNFGAGQDNSKCQLRLQDGNSENCEFRTLRKPVTDTTKQALKWNRLGKRKRGKPAKTWRRSAEEELA